MGGISLWQLGILLVIVLLLFGTKKLRNLGGDLGSAIKGFKKAVKDEEALKSADDGVAPAAEKSEIGTEKSATASSTASSTKSATTKS